MTDLAIRPAFSLVPQTMTEAMDMAKLMAESELVPKDYRNKPGNVLVAVQMGSEIGLGPMAAVQNIAVINGKPGLYGDAGKALLLSKGCIIEEDDIEVIKKSARGRCKITRPGRPPVERTFSVENAKTAKLWNKEGPWTTYPERQMAWRAFWYAARDSAADILKGLPGFEEVVDIPPEKNMGAAEVVPDEAKFYPEEGFATNLPTWKDLIATGKKTAEQIIATVSKKLPLTEAQQKTLHAIKPAAPAGEQAKAELATAQQLADIRAAAAEATITEGEIFKKFDIKTLDGLPLSQVDPIMAFLANPTGA